MDGIVAYVADRGSDKPEAVAVNGECLSYAVGDFRFRFGGEVVGVNAYLAACGGEIEHSLSHGEVVNRHARNEGGNRTRVIALYRVIVIVVEVKRVAEAYNLEGGFAKVGCLRLADGEFIKLLSNMIFINIERIILQKELWYNPFFVFMEIYT